MRADSRTTARALIARQMTRHRNAIDMVKCVAAKERHRLAIEELREVLADLDADVRQAEATYDVLNLLIAWEGKGPREHMGVAEAKVFGRLLTAFGRSTSAAVFMDGHRARSA